LLTPIQPNSGVVVLPRMTAPAGDHDVVGRRRLALAQVRAVLELHAAHGLVVLDGHRHPMQRADRLAPCERAVGGLRRFHRLVGGQVGEGVELRLESPDAVEDRRGDLDGRQFAGADGIGQLGGRREAEIGLVHDANPTPDGCLAGRK
jgi:hypothetical protein